VKSSSPASPVWPTAATHVAGVIGDPVRHSLSPVLHNAAFRALGLDWAYVAFEVAAGDAVAAVAGARALGLAGLSVTLPHKAAVLPALDRLSPTAQALGAVNAVYREGKELVGESTDGAGLVDALRRDTGFDPAGRTCLVLGAGGAARAVVLALAGAGATEVVVVNRTPERAARAALLAGTRGRVGGEDDVVGADLVVNATPLGMAGLAEGALAVDPARLGPDQVVVDLVYHPVRTPLLAAARERGALTVTGLGPLLHQAARAFRLWTGEDPPLEAMSAAVLAGLPQLG
jgi:shikimate dehydrogenase